MRIVCGALLPLLVLTLLPAPPLAAAEVTLAVAANFSSTAWALVPQFEADTGHTVTISSGSTGRLYAQILNGAPFDVFMAADAERPALLEADPVGVPGTRFTYARGILVLWSPQPGLLSSPGDYLKTAPFSRLAIASPGIAPYGLAARQALEHLGLWATLQAKLVRGDSVTQAFRFVASGSAQAGFVALSQALAWAGPAASLWQVPREWYRPIEQQAILLRRGAANEAARAWLDFLRSEHARAVIRARGYGVAP